MTTFNILNFQNLTIKNAIIHSKPLEEIDLKYEDKTTVVIVRDPYDYFNQALYNHIYYKMSPRLSKETIKAINTLDDKTFLEWFDKLNCHPLINPQTFFLSIRKNTQKYEKNLEIFDYVVPYDKLDIFLKNIAPEVNIQKNTIDNFSFSLQQLKDTELVEKFIGKDLQLYNKAQELWKLSYSNEYKSLKVLIEKKDKIKTPYIGVVDMISDKKISGWVFHKHHKKSVLIGIYRNNILLTKIEANIMRPDIRDKMADSNGLCGFVITFKHQTFETTDKIEIKTLPDNIAIKLGKNAKNFFKNTESK